MNRLHVRSIATAAATLLLAACGAGGALVGMHEPPAQVTTTAPIAPDNAQAIATRVLARADEAASATGATAQALRADALTGSALAVANAAAKVEPTSQAPVPPLRKTDPPKVLAVSRGTAWPRVMVVQSTGTDGGAVLNLLTSPDALTPFKLAASAQMHPGAKVAALDSLSSGSPVVSDGTDLPVPPAQVLKEYAAGLGYPKAVAPKTVATTDPFAVAVRANAKSQAASLGKLATLSQVHTPQKGVVAVRLKDGGAIIFGLLERTDTITLRKGGKSLTPSPTFQKLVHKKTLTKKAQLRSYETVVLTLPPTGSATVVGADEVLFSAKGA